MRKCGERGLCGHHAFPPGNSRPCGVGEGGVGGRGGAGRGVSLPGAAGLSTRHPTAPGASWARRGKSRGCGLLIAPERGHLRWLRSPCEAACELPCLPLSPPGQSRPGTRGGTGTPGPRLPPLVTLQRRGRGSRQPRPAQDQMRQLKVELQKRPPRVDGGCDGRDRVRGGPSGPGTPTDDTRPPGARGPAGSPVSPGGPL